MKRIRKWMKVKERKMSERIRVEGRESTLEMKMRVREYNLE